MQDYSFINPLSQLLSIYAYRRDICWRNLSTPMVSSRGRLTGNRALKGPLVVKDLAMEFVGQYNEPFVKWNDVCVVELSST